MEREIGREIERVFRAQQANRPYVRATTAEARRTTLRRLRDALIARRAAIQGAIYHDFGRPPEETDYVELAPLLLEIRHTIKHLKAWMRPEPVRSPLLFSGTHGEIRIEPMGTVLIIAPWNYPLQLAFGPLISALAAGNTVILKPSEFTPNTARLMKTLLADLFAENEVAVFEGDYRVAEALQRHPFDHVFLTGSPRVGKLVMKAAAEHLSGVTLELGGKSPTVVDETANLKDVARKVVTGKFTNAGQTCIAPDYLLVHESRHDELVRLLVKQIRQRYGVHGEEALHNKAMAHVINARNLDRLAGLYEEAVAAGAQAIQGGDVNPEETFIAPTLLTNVPLDTEIMQEEIFGPLLPILPYRTLDDALDVINARPKPLTLYIFSQNEAHVEHILTHTSAGTTLVNDTLIHFGHPNMPFGGVNHSGIGKAHGHAGFLAFSNQRPVLYQRRKRTLFRLFDPPYSKGQRRLLNWLIRYLQ